MKSQDPKLSRRSLLKRGASGSLLLAGLANSGAHSQIIAPGTPRPTRMTTPMAIAPGWAWVEQDGQSKWLRDPQIVIRDGLIESIETKRKRTTTQTMELPGDVLLPGFISGHTHCCSATPTRGIIEAPRSYRRPLEMVEELTDEEMDALTAFNLAELIRSGCTTQIEMSLSLRQAESYVRVAERLGARGYPGAMIPDITRLFPIWFRTSEKVLLESEPGTLEEIERNLVFAKANMHRGDGRIRPMMSPHACDTHTRDTLLAIRSAAKELGTGVHIHLSQGARETATVRAAHGMTPTQWLDALGILSDGPVFGAHMNGLDWEIDPPILRERGVVYAHCPSAGGAGGGTQPLPEALAAGMRVNVAIDTHSNDFLENLKLAVILGQARADLLSELAPTRPAIRPTIQQMLDSATRVPAEALGRDDIGVIREGARADLISIDVSGLLSGAGTLPPEPWNHLLYCNGRMVRTVMTDGRLQVSDGEFVASDPGRIVEEGGKVAEKLWRSLESEGWFAGD